MTSWKIELWDDPEYASGATRLAMVDAWATARMKTAIDGTDVLNIIAPWDADWLRTAQPRHVLKVTDELGRVSEWRIIRILDGRGGGEAETGIEAESLLTELARPLVLRAQSGGAVSFSFNVYDSTATQIFTQFINPRLTAEGLGHFVFDTVSNTTPLTFAWERYSCLELITEVADRLQLERWVERDDANTRYLIKLGTRGAGEPTVRTSFGRGNLQSYQRDQDSLTVSTVTIPTGKKVDGGAEKSTLGFAAWRVTSVTGTTLTLEDPGGGDGPIAFDDQLNGLYALRPSDLAVIDVTDSSSTGQTVTLANVPQAATYGGAGTAIDSVGTTATFNLPTGSATGDIIFAAIIGTATGTVTGPSGWTEILNVSAPAPTGRTYGTRFWAGYIVHPTGTPATAVTFSPSAYYDGQAFRITDASSTGLVILSTGASSQTGNPSKPPLVATGAGTLQLYAAGNHNTDSVSTTNFGSDYQTIPPGQSYEATLPVEPSSGYVSYTAGVAVAGTGIGITAGEHIQFLGTSSGTLAYELTSPTGVANYGRVVGTVDDDELRGERNWIANGLFTTWPTGSNVPPGFTVDPTPTYSTRRNPNNQFTIIESGTITSSTSVTGSIDRITIAGLTPNKTLGQGDLVRTTGGSIRTVLLMESASTTTGGTYQVLVDGSMSTGAVVVAAPPTNGSAYTNAIGLYDQSDLDVDPVRVKYIPGFSRLWASIGVTMWESDGSASSATGNWANLRLTADNVYSTGSEVINQPVAGLNLPASTFVTGGSIESIDQVVRATTVLTEDIDATLEWTNVNLSGRADTHAVRWVQLHLGPDSQVPPIYGSHGTRIWQRGNQHLRRFGVPPATYRVQLLDLVRGAEKGLAIADDGIALGGTVRLIDSDIGEIDLRIVELRLDAENPYNSEVTLANIPPRLMKIARRQRFAPPTRPDPTPPVLKPVDEEPTAPEPTILAPEIGVVSPETIKLVGDTWSVYA